MGKAKYQLSALLLFVSISTTWSNVTASQHPPVLTASSATGFIVSSETFQPIRSDPNTNLTLSVSDKDVDHTPGIADYNTYTDVRGVTVIKLRGARCAIISRLLNFSFT